MLSKVMLWIFVWIIKTWKKIGPYSKSIIINGSGNWRVGMVIKAPASQSVDRSSIKSYQRL